MMDVKVFIVSILLFSSLVYCKEEECLSVQRHTFELKDGANFSFSADIKENTGIIIDILFFEKEENDRIKLSKEESWRDIHNGENYAKTDLNYKLKEGWQRIDVFVETSTVTFICLSSKPSPLTISMDQRVKKITVSSKSIKICEESCDIKKYIEKNIDNEEKFIITAFTTTRYPIKFEISKLVESDQFGYIEIKPGYCIWKLNNSSGGIPCAHILHGWNALNIFVNSTTLAINNHIIPVNVSLRTFNISGDYLVNCTKGTPEWEISKQNISIPIYMGQEIVLSLTSKNSFSPVLEFDGNRWSLNWNSGLLFKFGSSWTPLQPNMYKIIFKATSRRVILYNKDKEDVLLDMKIEKIPEVIWVSCVKGTFKLSLSTSHLSTLPVTKTSDTPSSAPCPDTYSAPSYVTIIAVILTLVGIGIIVSVIVWVMLKIRKGYLKFEKENQPYQSVSQHSSTSSVHHIVMLEGEERSLPLVTIHSSSSSLSSGSDLSFNMITNIITQGVTPPTITTKNVNVEFFSPNVARKMHVRHLRSAIIGDSICRLLEFLGHKVTRTNHLGDWGTPIGMLLAHLHDIFPNFATATPRLTIKDLQNYYKESKKRFDKEKAFMKRANEALVKLQSGDSDYLKGWTEICDISKVEFKNVCSALDIEIMDRGESFYQSRMKILVEELDDADYLQSFEGKKIMHAKYRDETILLTMVTSDGAHTYLSSDLACLKQKIVEDKADWVIYVVDDWQSQNFKNVFGCAQTAGFYDPSKVRLDHVDFRVVLGKDGKKFKTRSGEEVQIMAFLAEVAERAEDKLKEIELDKVLTSEEFAIARDVIAYGCIKYDYLSHDRTRDYTFSFDRMLDFRGNTAANLLYALTKIRSIARTAEVSRESLFKEASKGTVELTHEKEWKLARTLMTLPDVLVRITEDLHIHPLCEYLYEVSSVFTEFNDVCYCVEKDKEGNIIKVNMSRMILCEATAAVMEQCFTILGIKTVEKM